MDIRARFLLIDSNKEIHRVDVPLVFDVFAYLKINEVDRSKMGFWKVCIFTNKIQTNQNFGSNPPDPHRNILTINNDKIEKIINSYLLRIIFSSS